MSPREAATPRPSALGQLLPGSSGQRKSSLKSSKEKFVRVTSPLTPWEDTLFKKRKSSLKGNGRQLKTLKSKDNKKKNKKENEKLDDGKSKNATFSHHVDINTYMKEYNEVRKAKLKEENSRYDEYGPEEIVKAYESLGIPKVPRISTQSICRRNFLPPVKVQQILGEETIDTNSVVVPLVCESECESEDEDEIENEISSPEARERRNNLNLSPLRKNVRLPDMSNFPVQTVSGINLLELARLATSRAESSSMKHKRETATSLSHTRFSSPERKLLSLTASITLQEKVMCRVIELSLPNNSGFQLSEPKSTKLPNEFFSKPFASTQNAEESSQQEEDKEALRSLIRKNPSHHNKLKKLDIGEPQNDILTAAIDSSRSCQSSVLSNAISSMTPNFSTPQNHSPTVRELFTDAVKNLRSAKPNCQSQKEDKEQLTLKLNEIEIFQDKSKDNSEKNASPKIFRKLSYKPATRKFIEGLYRPKAEKRTKEQKQSCSIEGKTLQKSKNSANLPLPSLDVSSHRKSLLSDPYATLVQQPPTHQSDSAKLKKRARQRQEAAEKYEQFKRALALDKKKQQESKLAIISNCQTVVKPKVSLKTVAI